MKAQHFDAAIAAPTQADKNHDRALDELRAIYETGNHGPLNMVAIAVHQYPSVTIAELTQLMREVWAEKHSGQR